MSKLPPLSLYIHIPWCIKKCPYCDFNSHALKGELPHEEYVAHLLADLEADIPLTSGRAIETIFIGGGTPSLLSAQAMQQLLDSVKARIDIRKDAEITMEANPGAIEAKRFVDYQQAGINRISIGIQSFDNQKLLALGRIHDAEQGKKAAHLAQTLSLSSFNLDLMHSLPDQTLEDALKDLEQAMILSPLHLSWYQLTIEPHTAFSSRPPPLPDEDSSWDIVQKGHQCLQKAGYEQYEISAYAKKEHQCRHNLNYWRFGDYLGIGCGAHGKFTFDDGRMIRTVKTKHPRGFMQGQYQYQQYDVDLAERPFEFFMNRFRLLEPTPRADFLNLTGVKESHIRSALDQALNLGYLKEDTQYWQVTEKGKWFLNSLIELFL